MVQSESKKISGWSKVVDPPGLTLDIVSQKPYRKSLPWVGKVGVPTTEFNISFPTLKRETKPPVKIYVSIVQLTSIANY